MEFEFKVDKMAKNWTAANSGGAGGEYSLTHWTAWPAMGHCDHQPWPKQHLQGAQHRSKFVCGYWFLQTTYMTEYWDSPGSDSVMDVLFAESGSLLTRLAANMAALNQVYQYATKPMNNWTCLHVRYMNFVATRLRSTSKSKKAKAINQEQFSLRGLSLKPTLMLSLLVTRPWKSAYFV